jgi:hypothetical protein
MSKRVQLGILAFGCLCAGWLLGQMTTGRAWGQATVSASSGISTSKYDLHSIYIGDTWETWRIDRNTGEAWHEANNELVKAKDSSALPPGDYDMDLITNGKFYLPHRIDRKSGRMWKINGQEWLELLPAK